MIFGRRMANSKSIPFKVTRNDARTLLSQVTDGLREAIVGGYYAPGDVLPTSRELAHLLGVSMIVSAPALKRLAEEGLVVARPRLGTVVRDRGEKRWRGHVVFVCPEGDENYTQAVLAGKVRDRLSEAGYRFTQVSLPATSPEHYDFSRLDMALAQSTNLTISMFARRQILAHLAKQRVPYAVFGEFEKMPSSAVGGTWLNFNLAAEDFAAACVARGVREVVEFCCYAMCDVAPALGKAGIGVRRIKVRPDVSEGPLIGVKRSGMERFGKFIAGNRLSRDVACFFSDDYMASGALTALSYAGLHAPEDVLFATFASKRLGPVYPRELSRMEFDAHHAGDVLADAVLEYLKTGVYPSNSVVGPVWVDGETMGNTVVSG